MNTQAAVRCTRCHCVLPLRDADAGVTICDICVVDDKRAQHISNTYEPTFENLAEAVRFLLEKQS